MFISFSCISEIGIMSFTLLKTLFFSIGHIFFQWGKNFITLNPFLKLCDEVILFLLSSHAKQCCFPSAHVSALALKCSIMLKYHKLKKRKHLPAFECKMREILNWQSQIILFFLQITITLLYDSNTNSLRLFIAHCNISAYSLRPRVQLNAQNHLSVGRSSSKRHTDIKW